MEIPNCQHCSKPLRPHSITGWTHAHGTYFCAGSGPYKASEYKSRIPGLDHRPTPVPVNVPIRQKRIRKTRQTRREEVTT